MLVSELDEFQWIAVGVLQNWRLGIQQAAPQRKIELSQKWFEFLQIFNRDLAARANESLASIQNIEMKIGRERNWSQTEHDSDLTQRHHSCVYNVALSQDLRCLAFPDDMFSVREEISKPEACS